MNNATKYWIIGGGAFAFLAIVHCMNKSVGKTPVEIEEADDADTGSPYYLTYNMPPGFATGTPNAGSQGGIVFGDINVGGGGPGGACCNSFQPQLISQPIGIPSMMQNTKAEVAQLPEYVEAYVSPPLQSLDAPSYAKAFDWSTWSCDYAKLGAALKQVAELNGFTYDQFLIEQQKKIKGFQYQKGSKYTLTQACNCIRGIGDCGKNSYLSTEILRSIVGDPTANDPAYSKAVAL